MDQFEVFVFGFRGLPRFTRVYVGNDYDIAVCQYDKYRKLNRRYAEIVLFKLPGCDTSKAKPLFRCIRS